VFQQTTLVGNVGNPPDMRYTPSGVPVCTFSLAVNKSWMDANGNKQDKTTWWRVTCWRKLAETVSQYVTKGMRVLVVGEDVEARAYTNRAGEAAASLEITANVVRFLSAKNENNHGAESAPQAVQDAPGSDMDVPF